MPERPKLAEQSTPQTDRRRHTRVPIRALAYIDLDRGNGGLILNISEDGIAVQAAQILVEDSFPEMRFRLPRSEAWIQAAGKIVWQGPSRKEGGLQFVNLSEENRQLIQEWISSEAPGSPPAAEDAQREQDAPTENVRPRPATGASPFPFDALFPSEGALPSGRAAEPRETSRPNAGRRAAGSKTSPAVNPAEWPEKPPGERSTRVRSARPSLVGPPATNSSTDELANQLKPEAVEDSGDSDRQPAAMMPLEALRKATTARPDPLRGRGSLGRAGKRAPEAAAPRPLPRPLPNDNIPTGGHWRLTPEYDETVEAELLPRKRPILVIAIAVAIAVGLALFVLGPPNLQNMVFGTAQVPAPAPAASAQQPESPAATASPNAPSPLNSTDNAAQPLAGSAGAAAQPLAPGGSGSGATAEMTPRGNQGKPAITRARPGNQAGPTPEKRSDAIASHKQPMVAGVPKQAPVFPRSQRAPDAYAQQSDRVPTASSYIPPRAEAAQAPQTSGAPQNQAGLSSVPVEHIPTAETGTVAISSHFTAVRNAPPPDPDADSDSPSGKLEIGQLASFQQPVYPPEAAQRRIQGTVRLRAVVAQNGVVESVKLLSGPPGLTASAVDAVRNWRYGQTLLDGHPVESVEDIAVEFRLANSAPSPR